MLTTHEEQRQEQDLHGFGTESKHKMSQSTLRRSEPLDPSTYDGQRPPREVRMAGVIRGLSHGVRDSEERDEPIFYWCTMSLVECPGAAVPARITYHQRGTFW